MRKPIEAWDFYSVIKGNKYCKVEPVRELESYTAQLEKKLEEAKIGLEEEMSHVDRLLNIPKHETVEQVEIENIKELNAKIFKKKDAEIEQLEKKLEEAVELVDVIKGQLDDRYSHLREACINYLKSIEQEESDD